MHRRKRKLTESIQRSGTGGTSPGLSDADIKTPPFACKSARDRCETVGGWIRSPMNGNGEAISTVGAISGHDVRECRYNTPPCFRQVAWLRVDTQTILTIASHVITKNHRIAVSHSDHRTWFLHIREVKESDRGWYMCQINTDPMKSQTGYLQVVGK
ncbi:hypothetical protein K0M31_010965 [Melipona bicolor]|uniref:Ig-like domain-containing protein n=1 Tax=Melipona bicolor TaxID=60889 RepID=A0AA40FKE8_9HYME|nr:hypothetical protein K0M31_010965 [Melipona bicolor]